MLRIELNVPSLVLEKQGDKLLLTYCLNESKVEFELNDSETSWILEWCDEFPSDWFYSVDLGDLRFEESTSGMPVLHIDKGSYEAQINLSKCDLINISNYIRGIT